MTLMTGTLVPIGRFARLSELTVKALRHYAEIGLLEPAQVDDATGYRFYALEQLSRADAIRRLRELELPLEDVRRVLDGDESVLAGHRDRLIERIGALSAHVAELGRIVDGEEELVPDETQVSVRFELHIEDLDEVRLLAVSREAPIEDAKTAILQGIEQVDAYLVELGAVPAGPPLCVVSQPDGDGIARLTTGRPADAPARAPLEEVILAATRALVFRHTGPYELLARAYRLLESAIAENDLATTGDVREIYVGDPMWTQTLIVWPVRPTDALRPATDDFEKRVQVE
jgi:DNA-binding transcriptional MerR regulator